MLRYSIRSMHKTQAMHRNRSTLPEMVNSCNAAKGRQSRCDRPPIAMPKAANRSAKCRRLQRKTAPFAHRVCNTFVFIALQSVRRRISKYTPNGKLWKTAILPHQRKLTHFAPRRQGRRLVNMHPRRCHKSAELLIGCPPHYMEHRGKGNIF